MVPIWLLGVSVATAVGAGAYFNRAMFTDSTLTPKIMGVDSRKVGTAAGLAMLLVGGPILGAIGAGLTAASLISMDNGNLVAKGLESFFKAQMAQIPGGANAQIPGPASPATPPVNPAAQASPGGWGAWLSSFLSPAPVTVPG